MESSSEEKVVTKRAPRKRAAKKKGDADSKAKASPKVVVKKAVKKVPRKRAVRKAVAKVEVTPETKPEPNESLFTKEVEERIAEMNIVRKAPTAFVEQQVASAKRKKQIMIVVALMVIGVAASAGVGYTDVGQIDVQKTIEARNERIRNNTASEQDMLTGLVTVPVQNTNSNKADGGLVGREVGFKPPAPKVQASSSTATSTELTASSTGAVASSTDAVSEDVVVNEMSTSTAEIISEEEENSAEDLSESASSTINTI